MSLQSIRFTDPSLNQYQTISARELQHEAAPAEKAWISRNWFYHAAHTTSTAVIDTVKFVVKKVWNFLKTLFCCVNPLRSLETFLRKAPEEAAKELFDKPETVIRDLIDAFIADSDKAKDILRSYDDNVVDILEKFIVLRKQEWLENAKQGKSGTELEQAEKDASLSFSDLIAQMENEENFEKQLFALSEFYTRDQEVIPKILSKKLSYALGAPSLRPLLNAYFSRISAKDIYNQAFNRYDFSKSPSLWIRSSQWDASGKEQIRRISARGRTFNAALEKGRISEEASDAYDGTSWKRLSEIRSSSSTASTSSPTPASSAPPEASSSAPSESKDKRVSFMSKEPEAAKEPEKKEEAADPGFLEL